MTDRLLIALLAAAVGLLETWHSVGNASASSSDSLTPRVEKLEDGLGKVSDRLSRIEGRLESRK